MSEANFTFSGCGCTWPVTGPPAYPGGLPGIAVDFDRVPFCRRVADLFATGRTKGVFQLGKRLGQKWTKSVAPRNREQVAALASVLRPGVLKSKDADGVSITQLYALRNNGQSTAVANSPEEAECLASTYFLMLYQEQLRALAKAVGRFDDLEAEQLQKTAAKKLPEAMAAFRTKFVEQAAAAGFDRAAAEAMWENIQNSGRYLFNKSHAWAYGGLSIVTGYIKSHNAPAFFAAWLRHANESADPDLEKAELVQDARQFGVDVRCPDLRLRAVQTSLPHGTVTFGLADVSGVGLAAATKLLASLATAEKKLGRDLSSWSWYDYLYNLGGSVSSTVSERLIEAGALDFLKADRLRMLEEYRTIRALSPGEKAWVVASGKPLAAALREGLRPKKDGGFLAQSARKEIVEGLLYCLENPQASLYDTPSSLEAMEVKTLGVSLTAAPIDAVDSSEATHDLAWLADETVRRRPWDQSRVAAAVVEAKHTLTKKGDPMIWLTITDGKTTLGDVAVFSDQVAEYGFLLRRRNVLLLDLVVGGRGGYQLAAARQL